MQLCAFIVSSGELLIWNPPACDLSISPCFNMCVSIGSLKFLRYELLTLDGNIREKFPDKVPLLKDFQQLMNRLNFTEDQLTQEVECLFLTVLVVAMPTVSRFQLSELGCLGIQNPRPASLQQPLEKGLFNVPRRKNSLLSGHFRWHRWNHNQLEFTNNGTRQDHYLWSENISADIYSRETAFGVGV